MYHLWLTYHSNIRLWLRRAFAMIVLFLIASKLSNTWSNSQLSAAFMSFHYKDICLLILTVFTLSGLNWLSEAKKWQLAISSFHRSSISTAVKEVLMMHGISYGFPMRFPGYEILSELHPEIGKVEMWRRRFLIDVFQQLTTLTMGLVGVSWFFATKHLYGLYFTLVSLVIGVYLLVFFGNSSQFLKYFPARWRSLYLLPLAADVKWKIYCWSLFKYLIFAFQLLTWFYVFGLDVMHMEFLAKIGIYYLISSFVPRFFMSDLVGREGVALYLFAPVPELHIPVMLAVFCQWLMNVALPVIPGIIWVRRRRLV